MITLGPIQSLAAKADSASVINCFVDADTITSGASPTDAFGNRGPIQLGTTVTTLAAAASGQQILVKSVHLKNISASDVAVAIYCNGAADGNQRYTLTMPANGSATYEDGSGWICYGADGVQIVNIGPLVTPVSRGGTGSITLTAHAVLLGDGASPVGFASTGTAGGMLLDQGAGADPAFRAMSGDGSIDSAGAFTLASTVAHAIDFSAGISAASITMSDGGNIALGTATGTMIGTVGGASGQKLGFLGATPIFQPLLATGAGHTVDDIITTLQALGLCRQA